MKHIIYNLLLILFFKTRIYIQNSEKYNINEVIVIFSVSINKSDKAIKAI